MTAGSFALGAGVVAAMMCAAMSLAFLAEKRTGNSGWIDVVWTFGLGATGCAVAIAPFGAGPSARRVLVAALVLAWALRLGLHIAGRTRGIVDDPRYARLKSDWGAAKDRQMFRLLQMQALASIPLGVGILLAAHRPSPSLDLQDAAGVLIFVVGLAGGALADRQLRSFARDPAHRGRVCDTGLWGWSRHPNYFFECVLWCAYPVIAIAAAGYPLGWIALAAPAFMTLLLTRVSGIPPLEEHMLAKYGADYRRYQSRVSALLPWPPAVAGKG